jgi:hypothetical protein
MTLTAGRVRAMIVVLWRAGLRIQEHSRSRSTISTSGAGFVKALEMSPFTHV